MESVSANHRNPQLCSARVISVQDTVAFIGSLTIHRDHNLLESLNSFQIELFLLH